MLQEITSDKNIWKTNIQNSTELFSNQSFIFENPIIDIFDTYSIYPNGMYGEVAYSCKSAVIKDETSAIQTLDNLKKEGKKLILYCLIKQLPDTLKIRYAIV